MTPEQIAALAERIVGKVDGPDEGTRNHRWRPTRLEAVATILREALAGPVLPEQVSLDPDAAKILHDNAWELYEGAPIREALAGPTRKQRLLQVLEAQIEDPEWTYNKLADAILALFPDEWMKDGVCLYCGVDQSLLLAFRWLAEHYELATGATSIRYGSPISTTEWEKRVIPHLTPQEEPK